MKKTEVHKILSVAKESDFEVWRVIGFAVWSGCRRSEVLNLRWEHISGKTIRIIGKGDKERIILPNHHIWEYLGERKNIGPVFLRIHKDGYSKRFKTIARKAGVGHAKFHSLRHSAASFMIASGIQPKAVQKILGHVDFRTTELYVEMENEFVAAEMEKMTI